MEIQPRSRSLESWRWSNVGPTLSPAVMLTHSAAGQPCTPVLILHLYNNNTMPIFLDLIWTKYHLEDLTGVYTVIVWWHRTDCVRWDAKWWRRKKVRQIYSAKRQRPLEQYNKTSGVNSMRQHNSRPLCVAHKVTWGRQLTHAYIWRVRHPMCHTNSFICKFRP